MRDGDLPFVVVTIRAEICGKLVLSVPSAKPSIFCVQASRICLIVQLLPDTVLKIKSLLLDRRLHNPQIPACHGARKNRNCRSSTERIAAVFYVTWRQGFPRPSSGSTMSNCTTIYESVSLSVTRVAARMKISLLDISLRSLPTRWRPQPVRNLFPERVVFRAITVFFEYGNHFFTASTSAPAPDTATLCCC